MKVFATLKTRCGCSRQEILTEVVPQVARYLNRPMNLKFTESDPIDYAPLETRLFDLYTVTYGPADLVTAVYVEHYDQPKA